MMSEADFNFRLFQAQQLINNRIRVLSAGPYPWLRRTAYTWEENGREAVSLVLHYGAQTRSLVLRKAELIEAVEEEEQRQWLEKKVDGFLWGAFERPEP